MTHTDSFNGQIKITEKLLILPFKVLDLTKLDTFTSHLQGNYIQQLLPFVVVRWRPHESYYVA